MNRFFFENNSVGFLDKNPHHEKAILFIHGNSFSSDVFNDQFSDPVLSQYRLLAVDLPGHGSSAKAAGSNYSLPEYARVVVALLEHLKLTQVVLAGHSLGGHIALEVLGGSHLRKKLKGAFIWGTPPLGNPPDFESAYVPNPYLGLFFQKDLKTADIQNILSCCFNDVREPLSKYAEIIQKTDPVAREKLFESVGRLEFLNELTVINDFQGKIALINCLNDRIISSDYLEAIRSPKLWKNSAIVVHSSHFFHIEDPSKFNLLLKSYASEMFSVTSQSDSFSP
ncbi:MAG: alpha/beta fold hydrolase, partial [Bacteriovoracia bacterium]